MEFDRLTMPCNRPLTDGEMKLLRYAMETANVLESHLTELANLTVVAESSSNWPRLELSTENRTMHSGGCMNVIADFQYRQGQSLMCLMVFTKHGALAGMECWTIDGTAEPNSWPDPRQLEPLAYNNGFNSEADKAGAG